MNLYIQRKGSAVYYKTSLVAQMVKHLSTVWETWVWSLGWEDSLEKEIATHSSTLALKIPWTEELGAESGTTEQLHFLFFHFSHTSKLMLKILQARLQQYMDRELPDVQAGVRKGRGTREQTANIHWVIKKARELQKIKNICCCFIDYAKAFDCVELNKLWKILKEMGIPPEKSVCRLRSNS